MKEILKNNCKMVSSWIDLDTHEERPVTLDYPKFNRKCDFHEEICTTRCLLEAFTSLLVRMYINYVLEYLLDLDLTLEDEKKLIYIVYAYASDLMYKFWDMNYCFFMSFLGFFLINIVRAIVSMFEK